LNLDALWGLVGEAKRKELKDDKEKKVPVVDIVQFVSIQSSNIMYIPTASLSL
jgi:hypothetical protein